MTLIGYFAGLGEVKTGMQIKLRNGEVVTIASAYGPRGLVSCVDARGRGIIVSLVEDGVTVDNAGGRG